MSLKVWVAADQPTASDLNQNFLIATAYGADAGGTDAYAITLSPVLAAYTTGLRITFKANTANTGGCTLNVNSLGAKTILTPSNFALRDNMIIAGQFVTVVYDGTNFVMQSPTATDFISSSTTATTAIPSDANWAVINAVANGGGGNSTQLSMIVDSHNSPVSVYAVGGGTAQNLGYTATWNVGGNLVITNAASATSVSSITISFYK